MRLAAGVSYCGKDYYGWQKQSHSNNTVQNHVEKALSRVADHLVITQCAGRTDSGVHATGQVVHFETTSERSLFAWKKGSNTYLPKAIRIDWVCGVNDDFHARFSASYRRYQYIIEDNSGGNALFHDLITPYRYPLNTELMHVGAQNLIGENDFSSFRAAQCQSNTPYRHIDHLRVYRHQQFVVIDIQANAFLYHMVRNIVGALLVVGCGKQAPEWIADLLAARDRCQAPATSIASGLYLVEVGYNSVYNIPKGNTILPFV